MRLAVRGRAMESSFAYGAFKAKACVGSAFDVNGRFPTNRGERTARIVMTMEKNSPTVRPSTATLTVGVLPCERQ